jgi:hypothetical protein
MQELRCPYCEDTTQWPDENELEMLVYGVHHRIDCVASPAELRAEAIVTLESMVAG